MKKSFVILFISILLIQCDIPHMNKNCKEINITLIQTVASYYKNNYADTQSIASLTMRWEKLFNQLCSKITLNHVFCIVEVSGKFSGKQEGLVYDRDSKNFYYFNRNGIKTSVKIREDELKEIYSLVKDIVERPREKFREVMRKSKNVTVNDAPNVAVLYIDLDDKESSYYFSIEYSNEVFGTQNK